MTANETEYICIYIYIIQLNIMPCHLFVSLCLYPLRLFGSLRTLTTANDEYLFYKSVKCISRPLQATLRAFLVATN